MIAAKKRVARKAAAKTVRKDPRKSLRERFICYALTGASRVDWCQETGRPLELHRSRAVNHALNIADEAMERLEQEGWFDEPAPGPGQSEADDDEEHPFD